VKTKKKVFSYKRGSLGGEEGEGFNSGKKRLASTVLGKLEEDKSGSGLVGLRENGRRRSQGKGSSDDGNLPTAPGRILTKS